MLGQATIEEKYKENMKDIIPSVQMKWEFDF